MTLQEKKAALLREKADNDYRSADLNTHIAEAIQKARAKGCYCPPNQLAGWRTSLAKLKKRSQEIQNEITGINQQIHAASQKQLGNAFIQVAKSVLDREQYEKIMTLALCQVNITEPSQLHYTSGRRD
jgi:predicted  nucleic acid-binding Zn-ribbon protein